MKVFNKLKGVGVKNKAYHLLRRSESFFKTDMVYLAKGGFWLTLGHATQTILGLILLVAFANLIPKEVYGTYQFVISTAAIVSTFTLTGMGTAITRAVAQGSDGALRYGFRTQLFWSIGIVVAAGILSFYYYTNNDYTLATALLIAGLLQPLISGFGLYDNFLAGKQFFKEKAILGVIHKTLPFATLLPTLFITNNPLYIVSVYFASHAISLFFLYLYVTSKYKLPSTTSLELSQYSKHLSVMTTLTKIAEHLDKILVWHFLGAVPVAAYTLAQMPIYHIQSLFYLAYPLSFSKIAQKSLKELKETLIPKIRNYFFLVLIIVVLYIIAAPFIFKFFFPAYPEAIIYSQVIALSLLAIPRTLIQQVFTAHEMKKELYTINLSFPTIRIVLLLILLPMFGIWGAVFAILITEAYNTALQSFLFHKKE